MRSDGVTFVGIDDEANVNNTGNRLQVDDLIVEHLVNGIGAAQSGVLRQRNKLYKQLTFGRRCLEDACQVQKDADDAYGHRPSIPLHAVDLLSGRHQLGRGVHRRTALLCRMPHSCSHSKIDQSDLTLLRQANVFQLQIAMGNSKIVNGDNGQNQLLYCGQLLLQSETVRFHVRVNVRTCVAQRQCVVLTAYDLDHSLAKAQVLEHSVFLQKHALCDVSRCCHLDKVTVRIEVSGRKPSRTGRKQWSRRH